MNMEALNVVCRIEKQTKRPAIFYWNECKRTLTCYTREEQHSEACYDYYRANTKPAKSEEDQAACASLFAHYTAYSAKYSEEKLVLRKRLQRSA